MTIDKMFSRIFRATIQSNIVRGGRCSSAILPRSIVETLQNVKQPHFVNLWTPQSRWINSTSSMVPLRAPNLKFCTTLFSPPTTNSILNVENLNSGVNVPTRSVVKFTRSRGKRAKVRTVLKRFYRLNWGIWIRTKAGRHSTLWRKRSSRKRRLRQHVFCNSTQSWLLDKMVSPYFRKPKYWVDDPYNPYHTREEFWITRTKPRD